MVQISDVADKLLTLDEVREKLASTEPLSTTLLSGDDKIRFTYDPAWALDLDDMDGSELVNAAIRINGSDHQMTKDAALQISSAFGLQSTYVKKLPANLLEPQMNYWLSAGMGDKAFNVLRVGEDQNIAAFSKPSINPFSNRLLLDNVIDRIQDHFGDGQIFADYKFQHSLLQTDIRLIVPEYTSTITDTAVPDDIWSAGVHLSNSLTGTTATTVEGYLFRYWCTNGATVMNNEVGKWSRRSGNDMDVYEWAAEQVDAIFEGMTAQFGAIQQLAHLNVNDNLVEIMHEIFDDYKVPVSQRATIIDNLMDVDNLTMYEIMQAITVVANDPTIKPDRADRLMRIGGALPSTHFNPLKAKVWAEGHSADAEQINPYEIMPVLAI